MPANWNLVLSIGLLLLTATQGDPICPGDGILDSTRNKCLLFFDTPLQWQAAQQQCKTYAQEHCLPTSNLASIHNGFQNNLISNNNTINDDLWIGGYSQNGRDFLWVDRSPWDYTSWQSSPIFGESCVLKRNSTGSLNWASVLCNETHPFVCLFDILRGPSPFQPPTTSTTTNSIFPTLSSCGCDDGWTFFFASNSSNGYCYLSVTEDRGITFPAARARCQEQSAELISIHSPEEQDFLDDLANRTATATGSTCTSAVTGLMLQNMTWTDGTPVDYTNWWNFQPCSSCAAVVIFNIKDCYDYAAGVWLGYSYNWDKLIWNLGICKKAASLDTQTIFWK